METRWCNPNEFNIWEVLDNESVKPDKRYKVQTIYTEVEDVEFEEVIE